MHPLPNISSVVGMLVIFIAEDLFFGSLDEGVSPCTDSMKGFQLNQLSIIGTSCCAPSRIFNYYSSSLLLPIFKQKQKTKQNKPRLWAPNRTGVCFSVLRIIIPYAEARQRYWAFLWLYFTIIVPVIFVLL